MPIYLEFNQTSSQFQETTRTSTTDSILLVVDDSQKKMFLTVPGTTSMIVRRTAERQAQGIVKTGFLARDGGRWGRGFQMEILGEGGQLPEKLTHSPREVY